MPDQKQIAYEKQLKKFKEHAQHFELIDEVLDLFGRDHGFTFEKNQWHRPCRVLRRAGNPEYVIEISQDGDWKQLAYREDLPHTMFVLGQATDETQAFVYRMNAKIAYLAPFRTIKSNLSNYLVASLAHIKQWTAEVIFREGVKSKHPVDYYRGQKDVKLETPNQFRNKPPNTN